MTTSSKFAAHIAEAVPKGFLEREAEFFGDAFDFYEGIGGHEKWLQVAG